MNIKVRGVKKYYEKKCILNLKDLEFETGKTYCIKGRNGTGKTTLLKIIANLLSYNQGQILYDDRTLKRKDLKDITYISQSPYIFNSSVYENIIYPLKIRKINIRSFETMINYYIDFFELRQLLNQNGKKCSSGEQMKIALIRALIFKPKLFLLDEPTTNLDIESIEKVKQVIKEIKSDTTIILVSHNMDFIQEVNDVCLIMKNSTIVKGEVHV